MYMSTDDADGNGRQIKYSVYDENGDAKGKSTITWGVADDSIASVDSDGILSAKNDGITTVTAFPQFRRPKYISGQKNSIGI